MSVPVPTTVARTTLAFTEEMKGFVAFGEADHEEGSRKGRESGTSFMFHLTIEVDDVAAFVSDPRHEASARGWIRCDALGGQLAVDRGLFNLFVEAGTGDGEGEPPHRRMLYRLFFADGEGRPLTMTGFKVIRDDPGIDVWPDTTTLLVRVLAGHVEEGGDGEAELVAAGKIHIFLLDFARQLTTFRVQGGSVSGRLAALDDFGRLFVGRLWDTYAPATRARRRELRHEAIIEAPAEEVWEALVDVAAWPEWNPTLLRCDLPLVAGSNVKMKLQLGPLVLPMRQLVLEVDAPRLLRWKTRQPPGVFEVERSFELQPLAGGRTHFSQYEVGATWVAARIVPLLERPIEEGYRRLAQALDQRLRERAGRDG